MKVGSKGSSNNIKNSLLSEAWQGAQFVCLACLTHRRTYILNVSVCAVVFAVYIWCAVQSIPWLPPHPCHPFISIVWTAAAVHDSRRVIILSRKANATAESSGAGILLAIRLEPLALAISCDQLNLCICLTYAYLFIYLYLLSCLFIVLPLIGFGCDFGLGLFWYWFWAWLGIPHTRLSNRVAACPQSFDLLSFMNSMEIQIKFISLRP